MRKEYKEKLKLLKIMDDDFARLVFEDQKVGFELLRILQILGDESEIIHYETQKDINNPNHRTVRLDVSVITEEKYIDIEIENHKQKALPKRARLYASEMDVHMSYPKEEYNALPMNIVIFICSFDYFKKGLPYYTIERTVKELGIGFGDQSLIIYVNGTYKGNDEIGDLIHDLMCTNPDEMKNEVFKNRVKYFKESEGGQKIMCKIWDDIRNDGLIEGKKEGRKEGKKEGLFEGKLEATVSAVVQIMSNLKLGLEEAIKAVGIVEEEREMYRLLVLQKISN